MMMLKDYSIKTICILLFGRLGDTAMRTPIVKRIREYYPNAIITVIIDSIGYELLKTNPDINTLITIDRNRKNKLRYLKNKIVVQANIVKNHYDLIIDLYGGKSSNNMMKLSFAKYQVGYVNGSPWTNIKSLQHLSTKRFNFDQPFHITNGLFNILIFFETELNHLETAPFVYSRASVDSEIENYLQSFSFKNFYLISLAASDIQKILVIEKSYKQIEMIYHTYGFIPVIACNPTQEFLQETLITDFLIRNNIPHIKLPLLDVEHIIAIMKHVMFTIVPDTGLYHLSVGLKIPTFGIFTYTNPLLVEPTQGIFKLCFQESGEIGRDGLKQGTKEIEVNYLLETTKQFIDQILADTANQN